MSAVTAVRLVFLAVFGFVVYKGNMFLWLGLFVASVAGAMVLGRLYCGYVCPMNTLMVPAEQVSRRLGLQTNSTPGWLMNGYVGWAFLVLSVAAMVFSRVVLQRNVPILVVWLTAAVLVSLRFRPAVFHNYVCPFGVLQRAAARFARFSRQVDRQKCIGCKLCEKSCQADAIFVKQDRKAGIESEICHQCTNCSEACPKSAITYTRLAKGYEGQQVTRNM